MLSRILQSALIAGAVWLAGIPSALPQIIPNPNVPPTPTIPPIIGGPPTPTPPPVVPPTVPPVSPIPIKTPPPGPTTPTPAETPRPTIPPVNPPPVATPTVPPIPNPNALRKADPQVARAVVHYGQNGTLALLNDRGRFQKVALQPGEVITLVLTLSAIDIGKPAAVQVLDGGAMTTSVSVPKPKDIVPPISPSPTIAAAPVSGTTNATPTIPPAPSASPSDLVDTGALMTVSQAGEVAFAFKPGADAGRHRVSVIVGGNQYFLQFWRQDSSTPNNNPRMLHAY